MKQETVDTLRERERERERELYFNKIKKAILEIIDALLNMQKIEDRNIKPVAILDTG